MEVMVPGTLLCSHDFSNKTEVGLATTSARYLWKWECWCEVKSGYTNLRRFLLCKSRTQNLLEKGLQEMLCLLQAAEATPLWFARVSSTSALSWKSWFEAKQAALCNCLAIQGKICCFAETMSPALGKKKVARIGQRRRLSLFLS